MRQKRFMGQYTANFTLSNEIAYIQPKERVY